jgi:hypothetical protein
MKIITIAFSLFILAFGGYGRKTTIRPKRIIHLSEILDTARYAILKFNKANNYYFDKDAKPATLSSEDIVKIEDLINKRISEYNRIEKDSAISITKRIRKKKHDPNFTWTADFIKNPSKYYKQLIPIINSKGEKEVWVNCFCDIEGTPFWKKSIVLLLDGGSCYFNLKINLTKGVVYDFMVNGVA